MKKHAITNLLFTLSFLVIFSPLCYLLYDYVLSYGFAPAPAKESLHEAHISPISVNRDFSTLEKQAKKIPVLTYHRIIPEDQLKKHHYTKSNELVDMIVTLENFTEQMNYLKEQNYTALSLKEFQSFMTHQKKVPAKSVFITFDDGYKDVFEFAYPVLKKHEFYAVQFLITGLIPHRTVSYNPHHLQYASIHELKKAADVFDYGNHTHSFHQRNPQGVAYLKAYEPEKVKEDLAKAKEWLGHSIAFAAPYGEYDPTTLNILKDLNIKMAFTTEPGYAQPAHHILEIPRQSVFSSYTMDDFKMILRKHVEDVQ